MLNVDGGVPAHTRVSADARRALHHLLQRHAVPGTGQAVVALLERLGHEVDVPRGADLLRPDALQHRLPPRGGAAGPAFRRGVPRRGDDRLAVGLVRRHGARALPALAELAGDAALAARWTLDPAGLELSELLVDRLGVEDVGAVYPHRVDVPPDVPLAAAAGRGRRAAAAAARGARPGARGAARAPTSAAASAARSRSRTPTRRWRCWPTRCAHVHGHRRRGLRARRQLVPDAHRRRAARGSAPGVGRCTWPRSSLDGRRVSTKHALPRRPPPAELADTAAARATCARRHTTIRDKRAARRRRGARLGGAARGRARRSSSGRWPPGRVPGAARGRGRTRAGGHVHWARDAAEANAIVAGIVQEPRRDRGRSRSSR